MIKTAQSNDDGLSGLLSAALAAYATYQEAITRVESKAGALVAAALALVLFMLTQLKGEQGHLLYWLTLGVVCVTLITIVIASFCILPGNYASPVVDMAELPDDERELFLHLSSDAILIQLASDAQGASSKTKHALHRKIRLFKCAAAMFFMGILLGIATFVVGSLQ